MQLKQTQTITHKLVLTQSMRQSLQCLQFSAHELSDYVQEAALSNPLLEVKPADFYEALPIDALAPAHTDWDIEFREFPSKKSGAVLSSEFSLDSLPAKEQSLAEYLYEQLGQMRLVDDEMRIICQYLISCLDHRGYLDSPLEELTEETGYSIKMLEQALYVIQMLDPVGVGARDLSECLILQLAQSNHFNRLTLALARLGPDLLARRDYSLLSRQLSAPVNEIKKAVKIILSLNPIPSSGFSSGEQAVYISPDAVVIREGEKLHLSLNERILPQISINSDYALLAEQSEDEGTRQYTKNMLSEANALIRDVSQRGSTLLRLMNYLLEVQHDFFYGKDLRPITMQQAAEVLEVNVSTISRAVQNKYLQYDGRIYPLRDFFSIAVNTGSNVDVSSQTVRNRISYFIAHEDKSSPLSDESLRLFLEKDGISISRRAVAAHRNALNLPFASRRKCI